MTQDYVRAQRQTRAHTFEPGQEQMGEASAEYLKAAKDVQKWIAATESAP